ncbi:hypothetical protein K2173_013495 [Erythroxylum novogranatense]|uniref:Uncharacterized protein n=1 Tax=Erythroxylum novogranatense TaxID=1862640 RepID=A0AAV8SA60_9ROSI|nr:hypothetical protein K2173_013495 [Erythroxylum novogranatense]
MSFESDDRHGPDLKTDRSHELQKKLKISYSRDFLLSLSELEVCKKLPSGFDQSLLSEFEDNSRDRFRSSGSLSSQTYRRNEYSSSPPTRGEVGNYSRGTHGRWDTRSSGRNDRDGDSQSDWDPDSGKHCGNQSRRSWQVPEHDGLLGSGSFPRPSGSAVGSSVSKSRAADSYQLNRSNEPYQPPRPYKAAPYSRRETNDSYNDETFGSSECTSEDQAEEERKRRASFELMRKEQHKTFQEKQKLNMEKSKTDFDITLLLEDSKDYKRVPHRNNELDEASVQPVSNNESDKSSFPVSAPMPRPLVPPGFSGAIPPKTNGTNSLGQHQPSELGKELEGSFSHGKDILMLNETSSNQEEEHSVEADLSKMQLGSPSIHVSLKEKSEKIPNLSSALDVSNEKVGVDGQFNKTYKLLDPFEAPKNSEIVDSGEVMKNNWAGESSPAHSNSILEKLFGSPLMLNGGGSSNIIKHSDAKSEDILSPSSAQSSKFAQWFLDEEKRPIDGAPPARPTDMLSLMVGAENGGSQVFDAKATTKIPQKFPFQSTELVDGHTTSNLILVKADDVEQFCNTDKPEVTSAVLTCEDLEQSIMSGITAHGSTFIHPVQGSSHLDANAEQQKDDVDDHASQHLLSLLQKAASLNDATHSDNSGMRSSNNPQNFQLANIGSRSNYSVETDAENAPNPGKPLTLEALFGTAFMQELQPVGGEAPTQRNSVGSGMVDIANSNDLSFHGRGDRQIVSPVEVAFSNSSYGSSILASNQRQQIKADVIEKQLSGGDPRGQVDLSSLLMELEPRRGGSDNFVEVNFPEEDRVMASHPLNIQNFMAARNSSKAEILSSSEAAIDMGEKLAPLNSVFGDDRPAARGQERMPFLRGPYDPREPDVQFPNLHAHSSSSQLHPPQSNHTRPMFCPLDALPTNINSQISEAAIDMGEKLAPLNSVFGDDRPVARGQERMPFLRGPYDPREPDVQFPNLHARSSSSQLHPPQSNHTRPLFRPLDARPTNINSQMKFMPPENIIHHGAPNQQFAANMLQPPFIQPSSGMPGLDPAMHNPMVQQIQMPGNFPPPQLSHGFLQGAQRPSPAGNEVTGFMQGPIPMQSSTQRRPNVRSLGIPPQGGGTNYPEALRNLLEMELGSNPKQIHPLTPTGHNPGMYGHELDMGFGYR